MVPGCKFPGVRYQKDLDKHVQENHSQEKHGEDAKADVKNNEGHDVNSAEQATGLYILKSATAIIPGNPVTVHADKDDTNERLTNERARKPRTIESRQPRTLIDEEKAHAKAVLEDLRGACEDCIRKKIKARDLPMTYLVSTR